MKKTFIRRTVSGIMALAFVLTAFSCGKKSDENNNSDENNSSSGSKKAVQTADEVISNSYRSAELPADFVLDYVSGMTSLSNGKILISGNIEEDNKIFVTDNEFSSSTELNTGIEKPANGYCYFNIAVTSNDTIFILANITDYGDYPMPDYQDPDFDAENYNYEALEAAAKHSVKLITMDSDGNILSSNDVTGLENYQNTYEDENGEEKTSPANIGNMFPCGDDKIIVSIYSDEEVYALMGADGKIEQELDFGENTWVNTASTDSEGNFAFVTYGENGQEIRTFDTTSLKMKDDVISLKDDNNSYINNMMSGSGDYIFYMSGNMGLSGVKADGSTEEIVNWLDSDLNGEYINGIIALENGDFIIYLQNYETNEKGFYIITKRDISELADIQIITMGMMYADSSVTSKVTQFNKSNDKFRIKIQDYSKYYEWDETEEKTLNTPAKQLKMDIVSGNEPDMIYCYDNSVISSLASKDVFADLYDFLGTNGTVSKDDIVEPLLNACEINGKLLSLSYSFSIQTLGAKTKFASTENWTLDDLISAYDNLPEGMQLFNEDYTKIDIFNTLIYNVSDFIDYENATCSYDSPEFIKLLEFCNKFPAENEVIDWETANNDEIQKYWQDREVMCRNDKALLSSVYLGNLREYAQAKQATFGDDITLVGYPSSDGKGGVIHTNSAMSILESSANKEACWEFISQFFDESYQTSNRLYEIPALKSAYKKALDDTMSKPYWTDENGKKQEYDDSYYIGDKEIKINPLTQEERDFLDSYITNSTKAYPSNTEDVYDIINEEVESYFAGESTAEETASIIQNRVSILISEQS